jgi:uncharacterized protein (DUF302 family)
MHLKINKNIGRVSQMDSLAFEVHLDLNPEQALERIIAELKVEGFGVLTRIDVKQTMKEKLDQEFRPYWILGACNPPLALKALSADASIGLMLPCNVTLEEDSSGKSIARIVNPEIMIQLGDWEKILALKEVAQEAHARLSRVALALQQK